jgi:hypothetical protein
MKSTEGIIYHTNIDTIVPTDCITFVEIYLLEEHLLAFKQLVCCMELDKPQLTQQQLNLYACNFDEFKLHKRR